MRETDKQARRPFSLKKYEFIFSTYLVRFAAACHTQPIADEYRLDLTRRQRCSLLYERTTATTLTEVLWRRHCDGDRHNSSVCHVDLEVEILWIVGAVLEECQQKSTARSRDTA